MNRSAQLIPAGAAWRPQGSMRARDWVRAMRAAHGRSLRTHPLTMTLRTALHLPATAHVFHQSRISLHFRLHLGTVERFFTNLRTDWQRELLHRVEQRALPHPQQAQTVYRPVPVDRAVANSVTPQLPATVLHRDRPVTADPLPRRREWMPAMPEAVSHRVFSRAVEEHATTVRRSWTRIEQHDHLLRRVLHNSVRQEQQLTPVSVITRREPGPRTAVGEQPAANQIAREYESTPAVRAPSVANSPGVDIEALASKVMQQIDRQLIAYRERMGRI